MSPATARLVVSVLGVVGDLLQSVPALVEAAAHVRKATEVITSAFPLAPGVWASEADAAKRDLPPR